jgi:hypothetical protein
MHFSKRRKEPAVVRIAHNRRRPQRGQRGHSYNRLLRCQKVLESEAQHKLLISPTTGNFGRNEASP